MEIGTAFLAVSAPCGPTTLSRTRTATEIADTARIVTPTKVVAAIARRAVMRPRSIRVRRSLSMLTQARVLTAGWSRGLRRCAARPGGASRPRTFYEMHSRAVADHGRGPHVWRGSGDRAAQPITPKN